MFEDILTPENLVNFNIRYNKHWKNIKKKYSSPKGRVMALNRIFSNKRKKAFNVECYFFVNRNDFEKVIPFWEGENNDKK